MQLNRIVLIGRLTRDPEERFTGDGMETSKFAIAVNRPKRKEAKEGEKDADFFNVVCFRHTAKFVNQYLRRGNLVAVEGRLQIDEYTSREGEKRTWVEVLADNVQNLTPRGEAGEAGPSRARDAGSDFDDEAPRPPEREDRPATPGQPQRGAGWDFLADDDSDPFADE